MLTHSILSLHTTPVEILLIELFNTIFSLIEIKRSENTETLRHGEESN